MTSPWQEWKKKNAERQAMGQTSPLDFFNPNTEYADSQKADQRMATCEGCPSLLATKQCRECGCFMPAKVKLLHAVCPKGYW